MLACLRHTSQLISCSSDLFCGPLLFYWSSSLVAAAAAAGTKRHAPTPPLPLQWDRCHCASLLAAYISGQNLSPFVPLALLFFLNLSSAPLPLHLSLPLLCCCPPPASVSKLTVCKGGCHHCSMVEAYISGRHPSSFVPLALLLFLTICSGPLLFFFCCCSCCYPLPAAAAILFLQQALYSHSAIMDVTIAACLQHSSQMQKTCRCHKSALPLAP